MIFQQPSFLVFFVLGLFQMIFSPCFSMVDSTQKINTSIGLGSVYSVVKFDDVAYVNSDRTGIMTTIRVKTNYNAYLAFSPQYSFSKYSRKSSFVTLDEELPAIVEERIQVISLPLHLGYQFYSHKHFQFSASLFSEWNIVNMETNEAEIIITETGERHEVSNFFEGYSNHPAFGFRLNAAMNFNKHFEIELFTGIKRGIGHKHNNTGVEKKTTDYSFGLQLFVNI